jgi:hypothetical protein
MTVTARNWAKRFMVVSWMGVANSRMKKLV